MFRILPDPEPQRRLFNRIFGTTMTKRKPMWANAKLSVNRARFLGWTVGQIYKEYEHLGTELGQKTITPNLDTGKIHFLRGTRICYFPKYQFPYKKLALNMN